MSDPASNPLRLRVVIPTLNAAASLPAAVESLRADAGEGDAGIAVDILVCDGGSEDGTAQVAEGLGARVVQSEKGRGLQLKTGGEAALEADEPALLLFLHADSVLQPGWAGAVAEFAARADRDIKAGYFQFALDDDSAQARRLEKMVAWRCRHLGLPYGDQGLLMTPTLYRKIGGYRVMPLMEDVDIIRRVGRGNMAGLSGTVRTSAIRYRKSGYLRRSVSNLCLLALYFMRVPPRLILRLYG